jgi:hypothetical protein
MPQRSSYAGVLMLTLCAAFVAACLSSAGLAAWADGLPDSAATRLASAAAHGLDDTMNRLRISAPANMVQGFVRNVEEKKF